MLKTIVVHDGLYHADDVVATCLALIKNGSKDAEIIRTRNRTLLEEHSCNPNSIVLDVGDGKYDHHRPDAKRHPDGHKYCAASLYFNQDDSLFYDVILKPIERLDNGEEIEDGMCTLITEYVHSTIPDWNSKTSLDDAFLECVKHLKPHIENALQEKTETAILAELDPLIQETSENQFRKEASTMAGMELVNKVFDESPCKEVIQLPQAGLPWQAVLCHTEAKFIIYPTSTAQINLQAVPVKPGSFTSKLSIPQDIFAGIKADNFVHANGHLAGLTPNGDYDEETCKQVLTQKALGLIIRDNLSFVKNVPYSSIQACDSAEELFELLVLIEKGRV